MKIFGYSRTPRPDAPGDVDFVNRPTAGDVEAGAVMVSIGGDGTFLDAVRSLAGLPMPIVGVNTGRLGFLASTAPEDLDKTIEAIRAGKYTVTERSMLSVEGDFGTTPDFSSALNEFTLHRHTADMIEVGVWIDGVELPTLRGDGVILSTPTGSTAYSLSAGGPLVAPECECFVLSAIAPHNFSTRPLVVPDGSAVEFEVRTRGGEVMASIDNNGFIVKDGARFRIAKSKFKTRLAHIDDSSFYDTLRDRIMWGADKRNFALEK